MIHPKKLCSIPKPAEQIKHRIICVLKFGIKNFFGITLGIRNSVN
jgi:hypothetical protein